MTASLSLVQAKQKTNEKEKISSGCKKNRVISDFKTLLNRINSSSVFQNSKIQIELQHKVALTVRYRTNGILEYYRKDISFCLIQQLIHLINVLNKVKIWILFELQDFKNRIRTSDFQSSEFGLQVLNLPFKFRSRSLSSKFWLLFRILTFLWIQTFTSVSKSKINKQTPSGECQLCCWYRKIITK